MSYLEILEDKTFKPFSHSSGHQFGQLLLSLNNKEKFANDYTVYIEPNKTYAAYSVKHKYRNTYNGSQIQSPR